MKRVLSLVLALVLVLGMMPTFAASATGAEELSAYGFISGGDNGDLMVDKTLTRAEMAVILSQLYGVKDKAEAFVAPANFTDVNGHWADSYIAYGQEAEWFGGYPDHTYRPDATVSAQELAAYALNALGYTGDYDFATADDFAATLGINVGSDAAVTRGEAFESLWTVVNTPKKGSEVSLGVELGKLEADTPAAGDLAVERVYSDNLKQINVEFNQAVDKDSATDIANYTIKNDDDTTLKTTSGSEEYSAELAADGKTVVITLADAANAKADQQDVYKVTAKDVKTADKAKTVVKSEKEIQFLDTQLPSVLNAEVVGSNAIKVTFSEPMNIQSDAASQTILKKAFKVNDGKFYVSEVKGQKNNTEALVTLYTTLKAGEVPFEITTDIKDYANFSTTGGSYNLTVVEDTTAPVVTGFKTAKLDEVVLTWSEDINLLSTTVGDYYHTNATNAVASIATSDVNGNELTLDFSTKKLAPGTTYVYVLKDAVEDLWGNKNTQQMTAVEVSVDKTAPEFTEIEYTDTDVVKVTFDENVDLNSFDKDDVTLLDKDGKEVDAKVSFTKVDGTAIAASETAKSFLIKFKDADLDGDYSLTLESVTDVATNEMAKTTIPFTAVDKVAPTFPKSDNGTDKDVVLYTIDTTEYVIKVNYPDTMATSGEYSVLDLNKYVLVDDTKGRIELGKADSSDVSISVSNEGKAVEIRIPQENELGPNDTKVILSNTDTLEIARVADDAGNVTEKLAVTGLVLSDADTVNIKKVEITGARELKVSFDAFLTKFDADDVTFSLSGTDLVPATVTTPNSTDPTVATYTFADTVTFDADEDGVNLDYVVVDTGDSVDGYGNKLEPVATIDDVTSKILDKQAPSIVKTSGADKEANVFAYEYQNTVVSDTDHDVYIVLEFNEAIDASSLSALSFTVDNATVTSAAVAASDIITGQAKADADTAFTAAKANTDGAFVILKLETVANTNTDLVLDTDDDVTLSSNGITDYAGNGTMSDNNTLDSFEASIFSVTLQ